STTCTAVTQMTCIGSLIDGARVKHRSHLMTSKGSRPHSSEHRSEDGPTAFVGLGGECGGPGDVAMAGGVAGVFAFGKDPACALIDFAQSEEIGGDVLLASREAFL